MKRFRFPLEKALEIRGIKKLLAEEKLGCARREEKRTRDMLEGAVNERERCFESIRASLSNRVVPRDMRTLMRYEASIEDEIWRQKTDLVKKEAATVSAVEVVVERTKEERTLLTHRENLLADYRSTYWWAQGKAMDEVGSQRFVRLKGGDK